jgi:hypothetical protein
MFSIISRVVDNIQKLADTILELPAEEAEIDENDVAMSPIVPPEENDHCNLSQTVSSTVPPVADNVEEIPPVLNTAATVATAEIEVQTETEIVSVEVQTEEPDPLRGASERVRNTVGSLQKYIELIMNNQDEFNENPCAFASHKSDFGFLVWLNNNGFSCDKQVYYNGIINDNHSIMNWCVNNLVPYNHDEVIDLVAHYSSYTILPNEMCKAIQEGYCAINCQCNENAFFVRNCMSILQPIVSKAISYGNINMLKHMVERYGNAVYYMGFRYCGIKDFWEDIIRRNKKQ